MQCMMGSGAYGGGDNKLREKGNDQSPGEALVLYTGGGGPLVL